MDIAKRLDRAPAGPEIEPTVGSTPTSTHGFTSAGSRHRGSGRRA